MTTCSGKVEKVYEFHKNNCEKEIPGVPRTQKYCVRMIYGDAREFGVFLFVGGKPVFTNFHIIQ